MQDTQLNLNLLKVDVDKNNEQIVSGRKLHEFLEIRTRYNDWFNRMLEFDFKEGIDFYSKLSKTSNNARPSIDHILKLNMAKELCMLQRTKRGKQARQYFIQIEQNYKHLLKEIQAKDIERQISIRIRKNMTDAIKEVIPETTHKKFAYPNYTNLVYNIIFGMDTKQLKKQRKLLKTDNIREFLTTEELMKVEMIESLVKTYLYAGLEYKQIKNVLQATLPNGIKLICQITDKRKVA